MKAYRSAAAGLGITIVLAVLGSRVVGAGQQPPQVPPSSPRLPLAPVGTHGSTVTPALEGWFKNPDGTFSILVGYLNRNQDQVLDIPVGPNNKIEWPGEKSLDWGQPTHFERGRNWGVFTVKVPANFGTKRLTYTIAANNQPQTITLWLNPQYGVGPYRRFDTGNTPPVAKLDPDGKEFTGPPQEIAATYSTAGTEPLTLTLLATDKGNDPSVMPPPLPPQPRAKPPADGQPPAARGDDGGARGRGAAAARGRAGRAAAPDAPITMRWSKHRGPGDVKFSDATPVVAADKEVAKLFKSPGDYSGKAETRATFSLPGEYILRAQVNDATGNGGGGDQCCWTNLHVRVTVKPGPAAR